MTALPFRPLGARVLIRPNPRPNRTASGLHLAGHWTPETDGVVLAVGYAPHWLRAEALDLAKRLRALASRMTMDSPIEDAATMLEDLTRPAPLVQVGDRVVFSWMSGQELLLEGERYFLMNESDLLAVVSPTATAGGLAHAG